MAERLLDKAEQSEARAEQLLHGDVIVTQTCIFHESMPLSCETGATLEIVSAFWNRREPKQCAKPDHVPKNAGPKCHANATDQVIAQCAGKNPCILPAGYTGCPENPFTFLRVRSKCKSSESGVTEALAAEIGSQKMGTEFVAPTVLQGVAAKKSVSLVQPSGLSNDHCNLLKAGALGCQVKQSNTSQMSSPLLSGDKVCRCEFFAPVTCQQLFTSADDVFSVQKSDSSTYKEAVFGMEGCDCYKTTTKLTAPATIWINFMCDLAVREEQV